jgi:hypothetical protein
MSNYIASQSYIALKPQVDKDTPIIPSIFFPLISESVKKNPNYSADGRFSGITWKAARLLKGSSKVEGDIVLYADPEAMGHILNMTYAKGSSSGDALSGYTHPFTVGEGKSYSIDINRGIYAERIFGARVDTFKLEFDDNKAKITASIKALGMFYSASLAIALTGAGMTSAVLSTDSDPQPAKGLCVGDVLSIGGTSVTLTSVNADMKTVGFASTSITASVGDPVYLLAQTASFGTVREPFYLGNALIGVGADSAAATTNAGARATATPCYKISMTLKNNLNDSPASGSSGPSVLLNQVREGQLDISRLFDTPQQYQKWVENVKQAITAVFTGRYIKSDQTTSEQMTVKLHKTSLMTHEEPLEAGGYIFDNQSFEAMYDEGDGVAVEITLINRSAGTVY